MNRITKLSAIAMAAALLVTIAGCSGSGGGTSPSSQGNLPKIAAQKKLGAGEGKLNIIEIGRAHV